MKEKRSKKKDNSWKIFVLGLLVYAILMILFIGVLIINQYVPTTLLPNIILVAIVLSGLFYLWLYGCRKPKRKIIQYMSAETMGMLCIIAYSAFATKEIQDRILWNMWLGIFLFYGYVLWWDAKHKKRK